MDLMTSAILREANISLMDASSLKTEDHASSQPARDMSARSSPTRHCPLGDHQVVYGSSQAREDFVVYPASSHKTEILDFSHSAAIKSAPGSAGHPAHRPHSSSPGNAPSVTSSRANTDPDMDHGFDNYPSLYRSIADLIRSETSILESATGYPDVDDDGDDDMAKFTLPRFSSPSSVVNVKDGTISSLPGDLISHSSHFASDPALFRGQFHVDRHVGKPTVFDMFDSHDYLGQDVISDLPFSTDQGEDNSYMDTNSQQPVSGLLRVNSYPVLKRDMAVHELPSVDSFDMVSDETSRYDDSDYSNASTDRYASRHASPTPHQHPHGSHVDHAHFHFQQSSSTPASVCTPIPSPCSSSPAASEDPLQCYTDDHQSEPHTPGENGAETKDDKMTKGRGGPKPRGAQNLPPCRVCGNTASGLHFGVNTCEACNEFFRRSLKRGATYYCSKSRECQVYGKKRNACSYCRYQRCVEMGMSRDAIKTGRYSHKTRTEYAIEVERSKIKEVNRVEKEKFEALLIDLVKYHDKYVKVSTRVPEEELVRNESAYLELYLTQQEHDMRHPPLPKAVENQKLLDEWGKSRHEDLSLTMHDAEMTEKWLRNYINYAKNVPGFKQLALSDQASLVRGSWFEFWFLGAYRGYNSKLQVVAYPNGRCFHKEEIKKVFGEEYTNFSFDLADRMRSLDVTPDVLVLIKTVCLTFPDRTSLNNKEAVERMHWLMVTCLLHTLEKARPGDSVIFPLVVSKLVELRSLTDIAMRAHKSALFQDVLKESPLLCEMVDTKTRYVQGMDKNEVSVTKDT